MTRCLKHTMSTSAKDRGKLPRKVHFVGDGYDVDLVTDGVARVTSRLHRAVMPLDNQLADYKENLDPVSRCRRQTMMTSVKEGHDCPGACRQPGHHALGGGGGAAVEVGKFEEGQKENAVRGGVLGEPLQNSSSLNVRQRLREMAHSRFAGTHVRYVAPGTSPQPTSSGCRTNVNEGEYPRT